MKRIALFLTLLLSLVLILSACGGTAQAPEEPAAEPTEVMEEEPTEEVMEEEPTEEAMEEPTEEAMEEPTEEAMEEPTAEAAASMECADELGCVEIGPGEPIALASALVITGPNTDLGADSQRGVELAIEFRGEVAGHAVELLALDDGCAAEGGQTAASQVVSNPQIVALIGTSCSGAGVPAAQIISDAGYVMVSPSNTSPALTDPEQAWRPGYLRTAHNDLIQGAAMADFAFNELGVTRAAAIHDGDPYTEGLASAFSDAFEALGGEMVAFEAEAADATNVEPLLTTIAAAEPEFVFFPVFIPLGSLITTTARNIPGLEDTAFLAAADGILSPSFLENAGDSAEGMYASGPDLSFANEFYEAEFLPAYMEAYGVEPTAAFHAHAYDATNMVFDAIEAVAQIGEDGTLLIGRQALRDALYATSGYEGITGTLTCDEFGDCADARISVSEVTSGEFARIWPPEE